MEGGQNGSMPPAPSTCKKGLALLFEDRAKQLDENSAVVTQGFQRPKAEHQEVWCGLCLLLRHFHFQNISSFVSSNPESTVMAE